MPQCDRVMVPSESFRFASRRSIAPSFSLPTPLLPLTTKSLNQSCHGLASAAEKVTLRFGISSVVGTFVLTRELPLTVSATFCLIVKESIFATRLHASSSPERRKRKLEQSHFF